MSILATPLDQVLGSTSKVRLVRLLIEQDRIVSAREAARLTGMSLPAVLAAIEDLARLGIIERERSGRQFLCRANRSHLLVREVLEPLFAAEARWSGQVFEAVRQALVSRPDRTAAPGSAGDRDVLATWVFGSAARGRDKPGSDLDLFVLTATDEARERVADRLTDHLSDWRLRFGVDVRPIVMSRQRAVAERRAGNPLMANAVRDARVVLGDIPKELQGGEAHDDASRGPG